MTARVQQPVNRECGSTINQLGRGWRLRGRHWRTLPPGLNPRHMEGGMDLHIVGQLESHSHRVYDLLNQKWTNEFWRQLLGLHPQW